MKECSEPRGTGRKRDHACSYKADATDLWVGGCVGVCVLCLRKRECEREVESMAVYMPNHHVGSLRGMFINVYFRRERN